MLLCTQTDALGARYGDEKAVRMLAEAGFDALDYSMFGMTKADFHLNQPDYAPYVQHLRDVADECGIVFYQAHAPFNFGMEGDPELREKFVIPTTVRSMQIAAQLGVKVIVVHPLQYLPYRTNKEVLFEENMRFYRKLIPYCEEFGIQVATENMFRGDPKRNVIIDSVCADADEFNRYIDELNSPWITGCLDIGHCGLVSGDAAQMIRAMGTKRCRALHVHDNDYINDRHTLPYMGKLNWNEITQALADIHYEGEFTFEADNFLRPFDDAFIPTAVRYMHDTGRHLIRLIEQAQANA